MCKSCFENEYSSFPTEAIWLEFDFSLSKKLIGNKMQSLGFVSTGKAGINEVEHIYICQECGQKWKLTDPDYSFRGYFKRVSNS